MRCQSLDLPQVEPIAARKIAEAGLGERVTAIAGDVFADPLPRADVITMGMILHDWNLPKKKLLIAKAYEALPPGEKVARVVAFYTPMLRHLHRDDFPKREKDLEHFITIASRYRTLSSLLSDMALEPPTDSVGDVLSADGEQEGLLTLSTIHSAKGLEWDIVHVLNATDGNLPSDMALGSTEELEEERRLFYVATTRPRRRLSLYVPLRFHHQPRGRDDAHTYAQRSRFLSDGVVARFDTVGDEPDARPLDPLTSGSARAVDLALDALWS